MSKTLYNEQSPFGEGYRAFFHGHGPGRGAERSKGWLAAHDDYQAEQADLAEERQLQHDIRYGLL